jgi:hypothetical protein
MKYLKILGLAAIAAMALTALLGVGTAGASSLKIRGASTSLGVGTVIEASLEAGNSAVLEDPFGFTGTTCTGSSVAGTLSVVTPTGQPTGSLSALSFSPCPHTVDVISKGQLKIENIAGTTNGTVFSENAEVKVFSTLLNQSCIAKTGAGTDIGKLTGATAAGSKATMDIEGTIPLSECSASSARWTGKYDVSKPLGLVSEA